MADYTLSTIAGNVGKEPEERDTTKGKVLSFSVAQAVKFSKDAPPPDWYNVAVWDDGMRDLVKKTIHKGDRVVVIGPVKERQYEGKTYKDISGYRVGKVDYLFPGRPETGGAAAGPRQAPDADDDLPF